MVPPAASEARRRKEPPTSAWSLALGEAFPLYAGGLGILAGDYLKTASDLGVPVVGVGLLYQEGYFRQTLDDHGDQREFYPYNDPTSLPIQPVLVARRAAGCVCQDIAGADTATTRVASPCRPGVRLYLLDSNDPLNSPADRGITSKLYGGGPELRFLQEIVLGIGGWRMLEALGVSVDVCHLNEGHAAFVVLERARRFMEVNQVTFWEALWATRAGNIFTTHTPVAAGFDAFAAAHRQVFPVLPWLHGPGQPVGEGRAGAGPAESEQCQTNRSTWLTWPCVAVPGPTA